jgi:uncharacterized caspase-like protein
LPFARAGCFQPALAEKRVALVIGNSAYKSVSPLRNPANDAAAIAAMFKKAGFDVVDTRLNVSNNPASTQRSNRYWLLAQNGLVDTI